jgi:hypothetical protein
VETMEYPATYIFAEDGTYQYQVEGYETVFKGKWNVDPVSSVLSLTDAENPSYTRTYTIVELTEKTFVLSVNAGGPQASKITFAAV